MFPIIRFPVHSCEIFFLLWKNIWDNYWLTCLRIGRAISTDPVGVSDLKITADDSLFCSWGSYLGFSRRNLDANIAGS